MFNIKLEQEKILYSKTSELNEMLTFPKNREINNADQEGLPNWFSRTLANIKFHLNRVQNQFSIGIASDQD